MDGKCLDCGGQKDFIIVGIWDIHVILPFGYRMNIEILKSKKTPEEND